MLDFRRGVQAEILLSLALVMITGTALLAAIFVQVNHARIEALLSWQEEAIRAVREAGISGVAERVAGGLIGAPILRARNVALAHQVTPQAAMNALRRLADLGLVRERTRKGRVSFQADRVVVLLSQ